MVASLTKKVHLPSFLFFSLIHPSLILCFYNNNKKRINLERKARLDVGELRAGEHLVAGHLDQLAVLLVARRIKARQQHTLE